MEHPEKALFDEVRGLRGDLEESKERILKAEKEYEEKVVNLEKRCIIDARCEAKLKSWKEKMTTRNSKVTFSLNDKNYTFFRSTFTDNIYKYNSELLPTDEDSIFLEMDKKYFQTLIEIIRKGNSAFLSKNYKRNFSTVLDKKKKEDNNYVDFLKRYFDQESFFEIAKDFDLKYTFTGSCNNEDLLVSFNVTKPYTNDPISKYLLTEVKNLGIKSNKNGVFVNYDGRLDITLKETLRTQKIFIKPFISDSNNFLPTNGASYVTVLGSVDGEKYQLFTTIPSTYGTSNNNYLTELNFTSLSTFKYLRFQTTPSYLFSLSYIQFKK